MNPENNAKTIWEADSTDPELAAVLREALKAVQDPEIGYDVIQLGLIRQVEIQEGSAKITMLLTTPFCPYGPMLIDVARQKAEEALKRPVTMELGMEVWDLSMMEDEARAELGFL